MIPKEYPTIPERTAVLKDWAVVCAQLDAGETPEYQMTEKDTRALYVWALKHRKYRISSVHTAPGVFKLSIKKEEGHD